MKYIPADKLITEIERQQRRLILLSNTEQVDMRRDCALQNGVYNSILATISSLQQEQQEVGLENYISNKLRELGADLINHKPYSFNRGLNVGETNAYHDILDKLNARKEE